MVFDGWSPNPWCRVSSSTSGEGVSSARCCRLGIMRHPETHKNPTVVEKYGFRLNFESRKAWMEPRETQN